MNYWSYKKNVILLWISSNWCVKNILPLNSILSKISELDLGGEAGGETSHRSRLLSGESANIPNFGWILSNVLLWMLLYSTTLYSSRLICTFCSAQHRIEEWLIRKFSDMPSNPGHRLYVPLAQIANGCHGNLHLLKRTVWLKSPWEMKQVYWIWVRYSTHLSHTSEIFCFACFLGQSNKK